MFVLDTNVVSELRKSKGGKADKNVTAWANGMWPTLSQWAFLFSIPGINDESRISLLYLLRVTYTPSKMTVVVSIMVVSIM